LSETGDGIQSRADLLNQNRSLSAEPPVVGAYQGTAPVTPLFSVRVKLAQFLFVMVWTEDSWDTP
jgi:hypothetical protein